MWPFTKKPNELDELEVAMETKLAALLNESLDNYANQYVDPDSHRFLDTAVTGQDNTYKTATLNQMRDKARRLLHTNAHAKNVLNTLMNFTIGEGFCVKIMDEDLQARWEQVTKKLCWAKRIKEIVRRVGMDGECFIRKFPNNEIRFVEPEHISTPNDMQNRPDIIDGVQFAPSDAETVIAYWIKRPNAETWDSVRSDKIFHFKDPDASFNDLRGRPPFFDPSVDMDKYDSFLQTRHLLNKIRASLAYIRKHKNSTPTQVKSIAAALRTGQTTMPDSGRNVNYARQIPGVGIDTTDNVELEFPRSNLDSTDAEIDGRNQRLLGACWFSLPEYMYACDARNANFSSTLVAETPGIKALQSWQNHFGCDIECFLQWFFNSPDLRVEFTWPIMVSRDPMMEATANKMKWESGVLSTQTWQERDGLVPEVEIERGALPIDQMMQMLKDDLDAEGEEEELDDASKDAGEDDEGDS